MRPRAGLAVLTLLAIALPVVLPAAPRESARRPDAGRLSALPSYVRGVESAAVGIRVSA